MQSNVQFAAEVISPRPQHAPMSSTPLPSTQLPLDDEIIAIIAENKGSIEEEAPEPLQTPRDGHSTSELEEKMPSASVSQVSLRSGSKSFKPSRASSPRSSPIFYDRPVEERMEELKLSELGENENQEEEMNNEDEDDYLGEGNFQKLERISRSKIIFSWGFRGCPGAYLSKVEVRYS